MILRVQGRGFIRAPHTNLKVYDRAEQIQTEDIFIKNSFLVNLLGDFVVSMSYNQFKIKLYDYEKIPLRSVRLDL